MKALSRTLRYLKPYLGLALLSLAMLVVSTAANLSVPGLSQRIIDEGIALKDSALVRRLAFLIVGISILQAAFTFLQGYLTARVSQGVAYDLRNDLYEKIQRLSFSYHDSSQTGQLLTRVTSDVELVQQFLGNALLRSLGALALLVGSLFLMLRTSPQTSLVLLVLGPVVIGIFAYFFGKARPLFTAAQVRLSELNVALQENLSGIRVVRAFVRRQYEIERFTQRNTALMDIQLEIGNILSVAIPLIFLITNFATMAVTWVGGIQVINERMTIGALIAFSNYILMAIFPLLMLSFLMASIAQASSGAERIFEILDTEMAITESPTAQDLPDLQGRVVFEDVWFRYFESQPWILQAVDFEVKPGQRVALLGATGSGKSTITNLIPRFYDATKGRILLDGVDIRAVKLETLRKQVGIVLQETLLFTGTIRENIAFGQPEATMEQIIEAAKAAQAHEFITGFPAGYDTQVGERGTMLSGGQKQRIAIARALLVNPKLLILDDATSSVDFQTELKLRQALSRLMENRTSFIIAQRVTTVRDADLILVLDQSEIVAMGKHEQLLEESAVYAEIYYSQLESAGKEQTEFFVYDENVVGGVSL